MLVVLVVAGNVRPRRLIAGDCKLKSRMTGSVLEIGVRAEPGVGGRETGLAAWEAAVVAAYGVDESRMLRPPHFGHLAFSPAAVVWSEDRLLRLPLRLGW